MMRNKNTMGKMELISTKGKDRESLPVMDVKMILKNAFHGCNISIETVSQFIWLM
jgi:hypothetical protein